MSNFYNDNKDILFHLKNMDISQIVDLKEDGFSEKDTFLEAPENLDDAIDNYDKVLEIVGEIAGEFVAPRAAAVDEEEVQLVDGEVEYAKGTSEAIDRLNKADLMGFTLPRKYGGLNIPKTIYSMAIEMISRADASLMTIFGLQEISDTIYKFGTEDQCQRYLPRFCNGEVMGSMALTEPDAGSDLQVVALTAKEKEDGQWYLNGVKRFITNGNAEISLVMARSELDMCGGRGISLYVYERDENMRIRRIENKHGIHGSPTCEMQFNDAPAELLGQRKFGLIKYTMSLMNGARLGIAAQAVGIAEAAYREAVSYAADRIQFNKPIKNIMAVYEMLTDMKIAVEAGRSLLYETSRIVDIKEGLEEEIKHHPEKKAELRNELQRYTKYAALFTPIAKTYTTEAGNKVCYDAVQIHGGTGYMKDFNVERHSRDMRITNIYEGTTQLQVVAAIGGIITGVLFDRLDDFEKSHDFKPVKELFEQTQKLRTLVETAVSYIKDKNDKTFQEYHAGRLVDMGIDVTLSYLLCIDSLKCDRKNKLTKIFNAKASSRCKAALEHIQSDDISLVEFHEHVLDGEVE